MVQESTRQHSFVSSSLSSILKMCIRDRSRIEKPVIFAIGNAPTALIELYDMIEKGIYLSLIHI